MARGHAYADDQRHLLLVDQVVENNGHAELTLGVHVAAAVLVHHHAGGGFADRILRSCRRLSAFIRVPNSSFPTFHE